MRKLLTILAIVPLLLMPAKPSPAQDQGEVEFWQSVKDSGSAQELEAYLEAYPKGKFAALARIRLKKLQQVKKFPAASGSTSQALGGAPDKRATGRSREKTVKITLGSMPSLPGRGIIGMDLHRLSDGIAAAAGLKNGTGVLAYEILDGLPAAKAGIGAGAVVLSADGRSFNDHYAFLRFMRDYAPGQTVILRIVEPAKSPSEFAAILAKAAQAGDPNAMTLLAISYREGHHTEKDPEKAFHWTKKGAEGGNALAMSRLAHYYYAPGKVVKKDDKKALQWYRKAAEKGHAFSMTVLGDKHADGRGVLHDDRAALEWYRKAAEAGDAYGMASYAWMLSLGRGSKKDIPAAIKWYRRAAALGNKHAVKKLEELGVKAPAPKGGATTSPGYEKDLKLGPGDLQKLD